MLGFKNTALVISLCLFLMSCQSDSLKKDFKDPPNKYRPVPFWHLNGTLTKEGIEKQIREAKEISGFGGVTVLPVTEGRQWNTGLPTPGTSPEFLSEEFFSRYTDMLEISKKQGTEIILYDDIDYPSGSAGGRLLKEYPQYTRKFMVKDEFTEQGGRRVIKEYQLNETSELMVVSAMNTSTLEVVNLASFYDGKVLDWNAPAGKWKIMFFTSDYSLGGVHGHLVDYMQPEAVSKVMEMTYAEYDKHFSNYFGNVIKKTFFDDVGFVHMEATWTPAITRLFEERTGKEAALYYPALFYDIGPETHWARVAFFDIRSELMAEGYVKQVSKWSEQRQMQSMGHPPENYSPNTVVAHGDVLKYYRHAHIPLLDAIFHYGRGLHGFKQVSSAADLGDKPIVGAELYGAFPADMDSLTLYRVSMEALVRGVNFVIPHGMWYDTDPSKIRIPPLVSHENPLLGPSLPDYSNYIARACMLLQGGKRVSDIALLWPIAAIQAETYINRDAESGKSVATWLPENVNHHILSNILTNEMRRDFTFIHPENLTDGTITPDGKELVLNNIVNRQQYKALIMPGGDVISASTLKAIKTFYDNGGNVIATASLPNRSAEFGRDEEVRKIILEITGKEETSDDDLFVMNKNKGCFAFIPNPDKDNLENVLNRMGILPDISFSKLPIPTHDIGYVNYIHKQKEGEDFYFLTNTTDNMISGKVTLRGKIGKAELWNPHTGYTEKISDVEYNTTNDGIETTTLKISVPAVSSIFITGKREN